MRPCIPSTSWVAIPYCARGLVKIRDTCDGCSDMGRAEQIEKVAQALLLIRCHSNQFHTELVLPRPANDSEVSGQSFADEIETHPDIVSFLHGSRAPDAASFQGHIEHHSASSPFAGEHGRQHDGKPRTLSSLHGTALLDNVIDEIDATFAPSLSGCPDCADCDQRGPRDPPSLVAMIEAIGSENRQVLSYHIPNSGGEADLLLWRRDSRSLNFAIGTRILWSA